DVPPPFGPRATQAEAGLPAGGTEADPEPGIRSAGKQSAPQGLVRSEVDHQIEAADEIRRQAVALERHEVVDRGVLAEELQGGRWRQDGDLRLAKVGPQLAKSRRGERHVADPVGADDQHPGHARRRRRAALAMTEEPERQKRRSAESEIRQASGAAYPVEEHPVHRAGHLKTHPSVRRDHRPLRAKATIASVIRRPASRERIAASSSIARLAGLRAQRSASISTRSKPCRLRKERNAGGLKWFRCGSRAPSS